MPAAEPAALPPLPTAAGGSSEGAQGCAPSGTALLTQTQSPLRDPSGAPVWTLTLHDSGFWSVDGVGEDKDRQGCLSAAVLADLQARISAAEIAAQPLGPDELRCMAMPITQSAVTVGSQQATWKQPCGAERPSASLQELLSAVTAATIGTDAQP